MFRRALITSAVSRSFSTAPKADHPARALFQSVNEKVAKRQPISASDFKNIVTLAEKHVRGHHLINKAVNVFNSQGHDFTEEVCSLYVRHAIACNRAASAAEVLSNPRLRLGAYLTRTSLQAIVTDLLAKGQQVVSVNLIKATADRGLRLATPELLKSISDQLPSAETDPKIHLELERVTPRALPLTV